MIGELAAHVWQSTWFAAAAGLLTVAFRKNRAKVRYGLWLSASLKFLAPFALLTSLGSQVRWAPAQRIAAPAVSFAIERIAQPFPQALPLAPSAPGAMHWMPIAILGIWACGFAGIAFVRLRSWRAIRAALGTSRRLEIPAEVEIRSSAGLLEPGVVGLLRPILLLPEGIVERLTPPQLESVLAHELCHVRRRDNLLAAIHMLVEAVFWFHPLVWWIGARLVEERERACDEAVLSLGSEPRIYAGAILNVCKHYVESPLVCVSGVTGAGLKRRIEAIMTNRTGQGLTRARKFLLAAAGAAALAGPIAMGVVMGMGHAPAARAAAPVPIPVAQPAAATAAPVNAAPQTAALPAPQAKQEGRQLVTMLFDLDSLTPAEQTRARQSALDFVQNKMQPANTVAIMGVDRGAVKVVQDFTGDKAVLQSAIRNLSGGDGSNAVPGAGPKLSSLETASRMLGMVSEKKLLIYFSSGTLKPIGSNQAALQNAIATAQQANVALYPIDVSGQSAPASVSDGEHNRRLAYAREKFGSTSSAMARTYIRYGPPDQIEDRGPGVQIWRYNYLENFHNRVEFEFGPGTGPAAVRINWPPPLATYEGAPGADASLADALNREGRGRGAAVTTVAVAGLPGQASFQIYPAGELQSLSVPLDSLSGTIDILGQIKAATAPDAAAQTVATVRDVVQASAGSYQARFLLQAGSYVCGLIVKEQATGRMFGETIHFEVK
jgi:beta-lactamase regulating signal transducer with metallopeptidase domain